MSALSMYRLYFLSLFLKLHSNTTIHTGVNIDHFFSTASEKVSKFTCFKNFCVSPHSHHN